MTEWSGVQVRAPTEWEVWSPIENFCLFTDTLWSSVATVPLGHCSATEWKSLWWLQAAAAELELEQSWSNTSSLSHWAASSSKPCLLWKRRSRTKCRETREWVLQKRDDDLVPRLFTQMVFIHYFHSAARNLCKLCSKLTLGCLQRNSEKVKAGPADENTTRRKQKSESGSISPPPLSCSHFTLAPRWERFSKTVVNIGQQQKTWRRNCWTDKMILTPASELIASGVLPFGWRVGNFFEIHLKILFVFYHPNISFCFFSSHKHLNLFFFLLLCRKHNSLPDGEEIWYW